MNAMRVARLQRARINRVAAEPNDGDRHQIHNEHHERHHERHDAVREQLRFPEAQVCFVETLFLMGLAAEARTTGMPVRISRDTRFTRSMSFCMILNFGIATFMRNSITTAMEDGPPR